MIGVIKKIEEWEESDCREWDYDCYEVTISIGHKNIGIKDKETKKFFRRYEFEPIK